MRESGVGICDVRASEFLGKELEEISRNLTVQEAVDTGQWWSIVSSPHRAVLEKSLGWASIQGPGHRTV